MTQHAYIVDAVRTARARRKGKFSSVHPVDLLTYPINSLVSRNKIPSESIEDLIIGCVTQTGEQGWCIGRAAVLAAGLPVSVPSTTVNRLCGSGQQAVNFGAQAIISGTADLLVCGGVEHMTRVPMFSDCGGEESQFLKEKYPDLVQQGISAEILAETYKVSRSDIDEFAFNSQMKAKEAISSGRFKKSIVPVKYQDSEGNTNILDFDDNPRPETSKEGLAALKAVFKEGGVITAGNASAIVDGAATVLLASKDALQKFSIKPRAKITSFCSVGSPPKIMLTGPIPASKMALERAGLSVNDIDIWEINEAFAPVPLVTMRELKISPEKINVNGGGISLGHPLGATGAILIGMALDELERSGKQRALITMCIGLGMGIATIIDREI